MLKFFPTIFMSYFTMFRLLNNLPNLFMLYSLSVENFISFCLIDTLFAFKYPNSSAFTHALFAKFDSLLNSYFTSVENDISFFPSLIFYFTFTSITLSLPLKSCVHFMSVYFFSSLNISITLSFWLYPISTNIYPPCFMYLWPSFAIIL